MIKILKTEVLHYFSAVEYHAFWSDSFQFGFFFPHHYNVESFTHVLSKA